MSSAPPPEPEIKKVCKCARFLNNLYLQVFDAFDADGSGSIDSKELVTILNQLNIENAEAVASELIAEVDADHNGKISYEEFKKGVLS